MLECFKERRLRETCGKMMKGVIVATRKSIGNNIGYTLDVMQRVIKLSQVCTPPRLSRIQIWLLEEMDEGVVVGEDIHVCVVHVASPHLECMHNGKHFSIMHRIVDFSRCELP